MTTNLSKQIVAMGGGGFSMEPENPMLDKYIFGLSQKERPKVCFIPTASGDSVDVLPGINARGFLKDIKNTG